MGFQDEKEADKFSGPGKGSCCSVLSFLRACFSGIASSLGFAYRLCSEDSQMCISSPQLFFSMLKQAVCSKGNGSLRFEFVPMVFSNLDNCHSLQKGIEFFFEDSQWFSVYAFETPWIFLGLEGRGQRRKT